VDDQVELREAPHQVAAERGLVDDRGAGRQVAQGAVQPGGRRQRFVGRVGYGERQDDQ
jgi:hypothetical protein